MELSSVLRRVRALVERAEHPDTPAPEAAACRAKADEFMEKYAIQEWEALKSGGATGLRPDKIKIDIGEEGDPFLQRIAHFVNIIANYSRCQSIWMRGSGRKGYRSEFCWIYGYQSDLRYFELLYTTLYLHLSGAMFPKPDPSLTMAENAYAFREAGLNWIDIAFAWGWYEVDRKEGEPRNMYRNRESGERVSWHASVGKIKKAALKEYARRGETPLRIPPAATLNFRYNAVDGYVARMEQRLREQMNKRGVGTEIILRDRSQNIAAAIAEDFPELTSTNRATTRFNAAAYARGQAHANTASLSPEAGASAKKGIEL
jgi:hypothetical protein